MNLPTTTASQREIIQLLYRYRFLDRIQIQALMEQKYKSRVSAWLLDLRQKHYIEWIYSTDFAEKCKPAIYYLGMNGIRYLKSTEQFPIKELRKRYRENKRPPEFIAESILVANCCITYRNQNSDTLKRSLTLQSDYACADNTFNFFHEDTNVHPQLVVQKYVTAQGSVKETNFLIEIFDASLSKTIIRKRLKAYVTFLNEGAWLNRRHDPEPIVLFVCPTLHLLIFSKSRLRLYKSDLEYETDMELSVTTLQTLKNRGITGNIWEIV